VSIQPFWPGQLVLPIGFPRGLNSPEEALNGLRSAPLLRPASSP